MTIARATKDMVKGRVVIDGMPPKHRQGARSIRTGSLGLLASDFLVADQIIQSGYPPSRIDILTTLPGFDFASCYASRIEVEVDGVRVNFIDLDNLKKNKQASGRHQDLADLENLQ